MLNILRKPKVDRALAERLLGEIVARARAGVFFDQLQVPDTLDGRFDLSVLHAWMVLERLGAVKNRPLAQQLTDLLFTSFDEGLRELGAGDIGMGRRMKQVASAFYGRLRAYRESRDEAALADALLRNVYRGAKDRKPEAAALARYAQGAATCLASCDISAGEIAFGPLPARETSA
jgi:cytochrome b pre-mRNA-processing protein 3